MYTNLVYLEQIYHLYKLYIWIGTENVICFLLSDELLMMFCGVNKKNEKKRKRKRKRDSKKPYISVGERKKLP